MASESPYGRLGAPLARATDPLVADVYPADTPYAVAHRAFGEWRRWRDVIDRAGLPNPFDLTRRAPSAVQLLVGEDLLDALDGLGSLFAVLETSSALPAEAIGVSVEEVADGMYAVKGFTPHDADEADRAYGPATYVTDDDILDGGFEMYVYTATGDGVRLLCDTPAWAVLYVASETILTLGLQASVASLELP
jgi:hypothetical protein